MRSSGQNKCNGCGLIVKRYHVDHIHPRSRSGTNDPENLQILCAFCNLSKGSLTMREWCAISNTRGNLFWRGREDQVPRGRTRDPHEQQRIEKFDKATLAKQLWDQNVDLRDGSTSHKWWPLLYKMTGRDAGERIELMNFFTGLKLLGGEKSVQDIRKGMKSYLNDEDWVDWPPSRWREDPSLKEFAQQEKGLYDLLGFSAET